jgi:hypothetical protein
MTESHESPSREESPDKFYLPAVAPSPDWDRIEAIVAELSDFHGVVPIPISYDDGGSLSDGTPKRPDSDRAKVTVDR